MVNGIFVNLASHFSIITPTQTLGESDRLFFFCSQMVRLRSTWDFINITAFSKQLFTVLISSRDGKETFDEFSKWLGTYNTIGVEQEFNEPFSHENLGQVVMQMLAYNQNLKANSSQQYIKGNHFLPHWFLGRHS